MKFQRESYFTLSLLVIMLAAVIYALRWPLRTNILILLLGGIAVILLIVQLCRESFSAKSTASKGSGMDVAVSENLRGKKAARRTVIFGGWLVGLSVSIWFIGFLASVTFFAFSYSLFNGGRWYWSVFIACLCFGITYGLFEVVIQAPWPEPYLWQLIGT